MPTKHDVIREHRKHPEWSASEIARKLGCIPQYVRATARRNGFRLALCRPVVYSPTSIIALGRAARAAGLTVGDIEAIGRRRAEMRRQVAAE